MSKENDFKKALELLDKASIELANNGYSSMAYPRNEIIEFLHKETDPNAPVVNVTVIGSTTDLHEKVLKAIEKIGAVELPKQEYFQMRIDGATGRLYEHREGWPLSHRCRIVKLLCVPVSDDKADPVGSYQEGANAKTESVPGSQRVLFPNVSEAAIRARDNFGVEVSKQFKQNEFKFPDELRGIDTKVQVIYDDGEVYVHGNPASVYWPKGCKKEVAFWRVYPEPVVNLTDLMHSVLEGVDEQSDEYHNIIKAFTSARPDYKPVKQNAETDKQFAVRVYHWLNRCLKDAASPAKDAHIRTLHQLSLDQQKLFRLNPMKPSVYPDGLVAGNVVQVIDAAGDMRTGRVDNFCWSDNMGGTPVKYFRRIQP